LIGLKLVVKIQGIGAGTFFPVRFFPFDFFSEGKRDGAGCKPAPAKKSQWH
jgi:hypothetical protein